MSRAVALLRRSTLPPFDFVQRWVSRVVWAAVLAIFLFWELTGTLKWTPWRTLSETAWDTEEHSPALTRDLEVFLLGLVVHIRYRTTLRSSVQWADRHLEQFDKFVYPEVTQHAS